MNKLYSMFEGMKHLYGDNFLVVDDKNNIIYKGDEIEEKDEQVLEYMEGIKDEFGDFIVGNKHIKLVSFVFDETLYKIIVCHKLPKKMDHEDPFLNDVAFIYEELDYGIIIMKNGESIYRNHKFYEKLGLDINEVKVKPFGYFVKEEFKDGFKEMILQSVDAPISVYVELINGQKIYLTVSTNKYFKYDTEYMVISISDYTEMKTSEAKALYERDFLNRTIESINEGVIILDKKNRITLFNTNAQTLLTTTKDEVMYKHINAALVFLDEDFNRIDVSNKSFSNEEIMAATNDGLYRNLKINTSEIVGENEEFIGKVIVLYDIADDKRREEEILYLSYHDVLTGLYNRTFFEEEVKRIDTDRQLPLSVIMGDLNGLKLTNDIFGHHIGDALLRKAGEILKTCTRTEDVVARWGGDEFIILLPKTKDEATHMIMERINREFKRVDEQGQLHGFNPSISLGHAVKEDAFTDITDIIKIAESNMYRRKMLSKESIYSGAITSMKTALFEKSNETEDHTNRVFEVSKMIAKNYQFTKQELNDLELLCMLHDVGKIGIDDSILNKPASLNDEEWVEMKKHSEVGFRIAQATPELKNIALYILYHHEKFDGTGYPKGLKEYDIPLVNRILSVADAYDAMTNERVYRKALTKEEAIKEIKDNSGTQFDPDVVTVFLNEIKDKKHL